MTDNLRRDLKQRYPRLFGETGYVSIRDGWRDLLERALTRIEAALARAVGDAEVKIVEIKQKYGHIRIYYDSRKLSEKALAAVDKAIELAEARSECTCETCGAEGRLYDRDGWYQICCPDHADGEPLPVKPGWENLHVVQTFEHGKRRLVSCRRYDRTRDAFFDVPLPPDFNDEEA